MAIERIKIESREQWLKLREPDITASVVGALFSCHPYKTALRLYAEKRGAEFPDQPENKILRRGRKLEPVVAQDVAQLRPRWQLTRATEYLRDPDRRLGATPDYFIADERGRRGVLQLKTAMPHIIERDWHDGAEPPLWILLQASTEMLLDKADFAAVAVLNVGDYETMVFDLPRNLAVETKIEHSVREFWHQVEHGIEPAPDYGRDRAVLRALQPTPEAGKVLDLRERNDIPMMLADRARMLDERKANEPLIEKIETELIHVLGDAERALVHGFSVSYKNVQVKGYEVKPRSSRQLRILDRREQLNG